VTKKSDVWGVGEDYFCEVEICCEKGSEGDGWRWVWWGQETVGRVVYEVIVGARVKALSSQASLLAEVEVDGFFSIVGNVKFLYVEVKVECKLNVTV
jgi:hypothetical protein